DGPPDEGLSAPEALDGGRVLLRKSEVVLGRAQIARRLVEEVDSASLEVKGIQGGPQRLRERAVEVFGVRDGGGDRRECGEASCLAIPLRRPDAGHVKAGGALTRDPDGRSRPPPQTPPQRARPGAAPPAPPA